MIRVLLQLVLCLACTTSLLTTQLSAKDVGQAVQLSERNTEVPFCYRTGGSRSWPIFSGKLTPQHVVELKARRESKLLSEGRILKFNGLTVSVLANGKLQIRSANAGDSETFQLEVILKNKEGALQSQNLVIRPAPPNRPITYLADQVDDLIRILWDNKAAQWRPVDKNAFDQYFRRLQSQGISRLIIWLGAYPVIEDPLNYHPDDWERYAKQARAILDSKELNQAMYGNPKIRVAFQWHGLLMRFRLTPEWGIMFAQSAKDHDIALTATCRPFEQGLMKYLVVPSFDHDGQFLWNFLPYATPTANFRPEETAFAHYRKLLQAAGNVDKANVVSVTFERVPESKNQDLTAADLKIFATKSPPIAKQSFVLVRGADGEFTLQPYSKVAARVESQREELKGWNLTVEEDGTIRIQGLQRPPGTRYLIFQSGSPDSKKVQLPAELPLTARAAAGNRVGRINAYWALDDVDAESAKSRIAGITLIGGFRTEFQAIENSFRLVGGGEALRPLGRDKIVVDFGADWLPEVMDFNRTTTRQMFVKQLKTILAAPAFDEIMVNTRSHTHLAGTFGDGEMGVQTTGHYRRRGKNFQRLTLDRAYAPLSAAKLGVLNSLLQSDVHTDLDKITTWQPGEWKETCQSPDSAYPWRYARNTAVASGIRSLLEDLEHAFPDTRIRIVIPPRAAVEKTVTSKLPTLSNPAGGHYDAKYYRYLTSGLNQIPSIGEGMSMINLSGLRVEPVLLGFRYLPDPAPAKLQLDTYLENQSDNHGSTFRGAKSFFYEAQETLRAKDKAGAEKRRKEIIRDVLAREQINEVILYEAADWTYYLPLNDPHR
ncbi:hypothetical protein [uncultured Gimesia sp.]|uniref:hypothetical protein n=1 Tax=uncultured Gimesia sp. TaxID=1678688 RepID=UPI0026334615|nr:hypothetical protein [uncultured Gimesia sp.]